MFFCMSIAQEYDNYFNSKLAYEIKTDIDIIYGNSYYRRYFIVNLDLFYCKAMIEDKEVNLSNIFRNLLLIVSFILVLATSILSIDLLYSVMLGCGIMGINYIWSISLVRKLINDRKFQPLNLLSIFTKFITTCLLYTSPSPRDRG